MDFSLAWKLSCFGTDGLSMNRVDRFLLSEGLVSRRKVSGQWIGSEHISRHFPVLLVCPKRNWEPKSFIFLNCWLDHEDFLDEVKLVWNVGQISRKEAYVAKEKLKQLKEHPGKWKKEVFGIVDLQIETIVEKLNALESSRSNDPVAHS